MNCGRYPRAPYGNTFSYGQPRSDGETDTLVSATSATPHRIVWFQAQTAASGPVMALVVNGTTWAQTAAPDYSFTIENLEIPSGYSVTVTATGGSGDGTYNATLWAL